MYMEVSILPQNALRLKTKSAFFLIDPQDKADGANALLYLQREHEEPNTETSVVIDGPGEYEIGGVKISGMGSGDQVIYSLLLDGVDTMIGSVIALEKVQHKVKEHSLLILRAMDDSVEKAAFATGLATHALLAYGTQAKVLIDSFGKENPEKTAKYAVTKDKLPQEMQTVLLANG